jgi:archaemetzincin
VRLLFVILIVCISTLQPVCEEAHQKPVIAIQPLVCFDTCLVDSVCAGIQRLFPADVYVLPVQDMPGNAFYAPRKRYRAEKILDYLDEHTDTAYTKIVGLTELDISTTKGEHVDWGIFGLGALGGRPCVVSTYRLGKDKVPYEKFVERLVKVVNHELGHTFGLSHCQNTGCLMEDAKGTIKTVDRENGDFCTECREKLYAIIR